MRMMAISKYHRQSAQDRVIELLQSEKGNPLSLEDISFRTNLDKQTTSHVIHSIQETYGLCQKNNKYFLPKEKSLYWMVAFGLIAACVYTFIGLIKYYNL